MRTLSRVQAEYNQNTFGDLDTDFFYKGLHPIQYLKISKLLDISVA